MDRNGIAQELTLSDLFAGPDRAREIAEANRALQELPPSPQRWEGRARGDGSRLGEEGDEAACSGSSTGVRGSRARGKQGPSVADFRGFTAEMLASACVLAGCDFLPSLPGVGYATAHKYMAKWKTLRRAVGALKRERKKLEVPDGYAAKAEKALLVFRLVPLP